MKRPLVEPFDSPYLVPFDGSFRVADAATEPPDDAPGEKANEKALGKLVDELDDLQRLLFADARYSILMVFQAMDAGGKDGTIRATLSGVNPAGCHVVSFREPSTLQRRHDFLWRVSRELPARGKIGVFNRSHYEEVLIVRVHPELLQAQDLPNPTPSDELWEGRFQSIRDFEHHVARSGTVILKFFLNVSREEQKRRFIARADKPHKHWKFKASDVEERRHWDDYMRAYELALNATSRPWAPWYAIPADDKPFMRTRVAEILVRTIEALPLRWPEVSDEERARMREAVQELKKGV